MHKLKTQIVMIFEIAFNIFWLGIVIADMLAISDFEYWGYEGSPWYYKNKTVHNIWGVFECLLIAFSLYGMYRWHKKPKISLSIGLTGVVLCLLSLYWINWN